MNDPRESAKYEVRYDKVSNPDLGQDSELCLQESFVWKYDFREVSELNCSLPSSSLFSINVTLPLIWDKWVPSKYLAVLPKLVGSMGSYKGTGVPITATLTC